LFIARESKLRYLCEQIADQKQERSVLYENIGHTNNGTLKLMVDTKKLKDECLIYENYLIKLRSLLLDAFDNITFPGKYFNLLINEINLLYFTTILIVI